MSIGLIENSHRRITINLEIQDSRANVCQSALDIEVRDAKWQRYLRTRPYCLTPENQMWFENNSCQATRTPESRKVFWPSHVYFKGYHFYVLIAEPILCSILICLREHNSRWAEPEAWSLGDCWIIISLCWIWKWFHDHTCGSHPTTWCWVSQLKSVKSCISEAILWKKQNPSP